MKRAEEASEQLRLHFRDDAKAAVLVRMAALQGMKFHACSEETK
jgi:hypothetical protein